MAYRSVQWGWWWLPTLILFMVVDTPAFTAQETPAWLAAAIALFEAGVLGMVLWFSRLEVAVDHASVKTSFLFGRPHRLLRLDDVDVVTPVRNPWYYGFGVRVLSHGSMYNVWGLDAVELRLRDGKVFRIGTNDVAGLDTALTLGMSARR